MSFVNTKTLDHIVHLTPPGTVEEASEQFTKLGFKTIPGGTHADGLTANALVVLADGVYLELISYTHPPSHYPPGSPQRRDRDNHEWATKYPGWIDFAFLGNGSLTTRISDIINQRAKQDGSGAVYVPDWEAGRNRPDGKVLKWVISAPRPGARGTLPFFCGDVTPREWRVPADPPSNTNHPSTASGIAHIRVLTSKDTFTSISKQLSSVIGDPPISSTDNETIWVLDSTRHRAPRLILNAPNNTIESEFVDRVKTGIYEVGIFVDHGKGKEGSQTPYGRIAWVPRA